MNPNLPSSPIVSGALPLPAANPSATPATVVPNLAPPGAGLNPPPVFNQAPMPQLSPALPVGIPQAPLNPVLPPPVTPQAMNPQVLPAAPVQMVTPPQTTPDMPLAPQAMNPQVLPTAPVQMVTLPQAAPMPMPSVVALPNVTGNIAVVPTMGGMLTPQPAQANVAPVPEEMLDRKVFTKPFVIILIVSSILVLIAGLFFWSYIRTP